MQNPVAFQGGRDAVSSPRSRVLQSHGGNLCTAGGVEGGSVAVELRPKRCTVYLGQAYSCRHRNIGSYNCCHAR
eukprot:12925094-Prorocentrum_lima.AAC.1